MGGKSGLLTSVGATGAELILGHGWDPKDKGPLNASLDPESEDSRVLEGNKIVDTYFKKTFKPTAQVIEINQQFFRRLSSVDDIVVIGHSIAHVDLPYFFEVIRNIDCGRVRWRVSYHDDLMTVSHQVAELGLLESLVRYLRPSEL